MVPVRYWARGRQPDAVPGDTTRRARLAATAALVAATALAGWAPPGQAVQASSTFAVTVRLVSPNQGETGTCRTDSGQSAFGASLTVLCSSEPTAPTAPASPSSNRTTSDGYRFLTYITKDELSTTVDSYAGVGTTTAFRVLHARGRPYVEMTVGW